MQDVNIRKCWMKNMWGISVLLWNFSVSLNYFKKGGTLFQVNERKERVKKGRGSWLY